VAESARQQRASASGANVAEFSVSELAGAVKRTLEQTYGYVRLRGEISGYRGPHSSGHCYFSLKDDKAKIEAVIWRGVFSALRFKPEEGMEVIATGKVTTYPGSSKYQIVIEHLEPAGAGALMALLEERKRKLAAEGLFADERKRKLPYLPRVVGIVTSPTGAVIRDMLHGFNERYPTHVVLWPVRVQGETCAAEVASAIRGFNALSPAGRIPRPDVLIVARGGGSLEDLWGFNEEIVVRAAAESAIPLISAVGHETDWTLIDLAADARAPTPTKAAEWAVPKYSDLIDAIAKLESRLRVSVRRGLDANRNALRAAARGLPRPQDLVALPRQRFDGTAQRLLHALAKNTTAHHRRFDRLAPRLDPRLLQGRIERHHNRLADLTHKASAALARLTNQRRQRAERLAGRLMPQLLVNRIARARLAVEGHHKMLQALSYQGVLARGFALVRDTAGNTVRSASALAPGQHVTLEFGDGRCAAEVLPDRAGSPVTASDTSASPHQSATPSIRARPAKRGEPGGSQGSLF
jgi:exodeoxyribonuclease VII large subunit